MQVFYFNKLNYRVQEYVAIRKLMYNLEYMDRNSPEFRRAPKPIGIKPPEGTILYQQGLFNDEADIPASFGVYEISHVRFDAGNNKRGIEGIIEGTDVIFEPLHVRARFSRRDLTAQDINRTAEIVKGIDQNHRAHRFLIDVANLGGTTIEALGAFPSFTGSRPVDSADLKRQLAETTGIYLSKTAEREVELKAKSDALVLEADSLGVTDISYKLEGNQEIKIKTEAAAIKAAGHG